VWWLATCIRLEQGLINHIDNLPSRTRAIEESGVRHSGCNDIHPEHRYDIDSSDHSDSASNKEDRILKDCEEFLLTSKASRKKICNASRKQKSLATERKSRSYKVVKTGIKTETRYPQTEGISQTELDRWKTAQKCLCCACISKM